MSSEGRIALLAALLRMKQAELARRICVTQQAVSLWASGGRVPQSHRTRAALQRELGIDPLAWDRPASPSTAANSAGCFHAQGRRERGADCELPHTVTGQKPAENKGSGRGITLEPSVTIENVASHGRPRR